MGRGGVSIAPSFPGAALWGGAQNSWLLLCSALVESLFRGQNWLRLLPAPSLTADPLRFYHPHCKHTHLSITCASVNVSKSRSAASDCPPGGSGESVFLVWLLIAVTAADTYFGTLISCVKQGVVR